KRHRERTPRSNRGTRRRQYGNDHLQLGPPQQVSSVRTPWPLLSVDNRKRPQNCCRMSSITNSAADMGNGMVTICTIYLYNLSVQSTCTTYLYNLPVQLICTIYLYNLSVQSTCTTYLHNLPVQPICTMCLFRLSVLSYCNRSLKSISSMKFL